MMENFLPITIFRAEGTLCLKQVAPISKSLII